MSKRTGFLLGLVFGISVFLMFFTLVSAAKEEIGFVPNQTMDIIIKCADTDAELCSATTACNLDIFYPNMSIYIKSGIMSNNETFFSYICNATPTVGVFSAFVNCSDGTTSGYSSWSFYVGRPSTAVQISSVILAVVVLFGIAILLFYGYMKNEKFIFKWTFFLLSILFIVISVNIVSIVLRNEAGSSNIRNIFDTLGAACYWFYWLIGGLLLTFWIMTTIASIGNRQNMKRAAAIGEPLDMEKLR